MTEQYSSAENTQQDIEAQAAEPTGPLTGKPVEKTAAQAPKVPSSRKSRKSASAFRTISEVADILDVQQHVLRFWETKFSQIRPLKRGGGRRYYRPEDLELLKKIHHLLYTEGYTIKGVQKLLREKGKAQLLQEQPTAPAQNNNEPSITASVKGSVAVGMSNPERKALKSVVGELRALREIITGE